MPLRKLALSNFSTRKVRTALTIAAVAFSVALVVAVTSGYASAEAAAMRFLNQFMGSTDAQIGRINDGRGGVRESLVEELRHDPDVRRATGRLEMETGLIDLQGKPIPGRPAQVIGIRRPQDTRIENLNIISGKLFDTSDGNIAVIDQVAARVLKDPKNIAEDAPALRVGDTFKLPGVRGQLELTIVGIVRKPAIVAAQLQTIYLPIETLQKFAMPDEPPQVGRILIDLKRDADANAFLNRWRKKLAVSDPVLRITLSRDNRSEMEKNLQGVHFLSYLGGTVSMLAATFIVFSSLSMGVAERQRSLAVLRAVGACRSQIGWLVVLEGVALATVGAIVGVPLGWLCVVALSLRFEVLFSAGVVMSWGGVLFGALGSLAAAVVASFLPAWSAMRVSPLEAMGSIASEPASRVPIGCAIAGAICIAIDPFLMFGPLRSWAAALGFAAPDAVARGLQFYGHFAFGLPGIMIGFFLLAPLFVWLIERLAGPTVAAMLGVRYGLLRQQLSAGIWRAAGTCSALMVGLAILVVMQTQGKTMLNGWKLPDKFPDIFITTPAGLKVDDMWRLERVSGIRKGEVLPMAIASPEFGTSILAILGAAVVPDATMFFGVDPDKCMRMMELEFRDGNPTDAARLLKQGRHLIITDEFRQLKGLKVGDKLPLRSIHGRVDYTVAGVVWSPGIDVMVSRFDLGKQFEQRTAASVFGSLDDARNDFGVDKIYFFAANLDYFLDKEKVVENVKKEFGAMGVQAYDVRQIKKAIQDGLSHLLLLVSTVAFAAMAVASLGVTNTIMASVRSRQWQFGILRSIGVTRWQLLRLVMAEAILLGVVGCAMGLVAGFEMSINAKQLSTNILGYNPPMFIPWNIVWTGTAIVMFIAIAASAGPAISVARTEPLTLLQAGRASA